MYKCFGSFLKVIPALMMLSSVFVSTANIAASLVVGDPAPGFILEGTDDQNYTLAQFKNRLYVVIAFFPKAFTSGWTLECKALRDSDKEIQNFQVAYFMASVDSVEINKGFAKKNAATFPILSDPGKQMVEEYGALSEAGYARRWTYYINKQGIIVRIDKDVDPRTAGKTLVKSLLELGVSKK